MHARRIVVAGWMAAVLATACAAPSTPVSTAGAGKPAAKRRAAPASTPASGAPSPDGPATSPTPTAPTSAAASVAASVPPSAAPSPAPSPDAAQLPPNLLGLAPAGGGPGATITLTVENVDATKATGIAVAFGGVAAKAVEVVDATTLRVAVPDGAASGDVVVTVGAMAGAGKPFKVVTRIKIAQAHFRGLAAGAPKALIATTLGADGGTLAGAALAWTVEGEAVTVDGAGAVTVVKPGFARVVAASGTVTEARVIEVLAAEPAVGSLPGTGVVLIPRPTPTPSAAPTPNGYKTLLGPRALAYEAATRRLYVADADRHRIVYYDLAAPGGPPTELVGNPGDSGDDDGDLETATFDDPEGLALDAANRRLYVADSDAKKIRMIDLATGQVCTTTGTGAEGTTDGPAGVATFLLPRALAYDGLRYLYVSDYEGHNIRRIDTQAPERAVTTIAGSRTAARGHLDGPGDAARFAEPDGLAIGPDGDLYVADGSNQVIRKVALAGSGFATTTFAGLPGSEGFFDFTGTAAGFDDPAGLAFDQAGDLYVADEDNRRIRKITRRGEVVTVAGSGVKGLADGPASSAAFDVMGLPALVEQDGMAVLYVPDTRQNVVRTIVLVPAPSPSP